MSDSLANNLWVLTGKEQARAYAYKQDARFAILSNGN